MRSKGETLQPSQLCTQELLKLQVHTSVSLLLFALETAITVADFHFTFHLTLCSAVQDAYEVLVEMVGSKRSGLNQSLVLKAQYERALQDLVDLVDTAQDKMAADQKMKVGSVIEVQILLDKHKVQQPCFVINWF